jgi:serine protease AprX
MTKHQTLKVRDMIKGETERGRRVERWLTLPRAIALLAVFLAVATVFTAQTALARPVLDVGSSGAVTGAVIAAPIPGQTIYTVAFSGHTAADLQAVKCRVTGIVTANGGRLLYDYPAISAVAVCVPDGVADRLRVVPGVRYVEADVEYQLSMDQVSEQLNLTALWDLGDGYDGAGVTICVIDSGAATWHPDLRGKISKIYNFIPGDPAIIDTSGNNYLNGKDDSLSGHGTFVASQIVGSGAASTGLNGGPGIYAGTLPGYTGSSDSSDPAYRELRGPFKGLAPGVTLYPMRVSIGSGAASSAIKQAIQAAITLHETGDCDIISMSMNSGVEDQSMNEIVQAAIDSGIVVVVSAGNAGDKPVTVQCPANLAEVITVGAVTRNDEVADFSSRGPTRSGLIKPDITAVGETIIAASRDLSDAGSQSTATPYDPGKNFERYYQEYSGTSMATPEVSAAAALIIQCYREKVQNSNPGLPDLTPYQVKQILIDTARHPYGCPAEGDSNWGYGVLDVYAAIKLVESGAIPTAEATTVPSASFEKAEYTVSESQSLLNVNVHVTDIPANGIQLKVEAYSGSGAIPGQDFTADTRILSFTPAVTTRAFPVSIIANNAQDESRAFTVKISRVNADDNVYISSDICKVTILDDDQAVVSFSADSYTVKEPLEAITVPITIKADWTRNRAAGDITVRIETIGGSATPGSDFTPIGPVDQLVTIARSSTSLVVEKTVNVQILPATIINQEVVAEGLESFTVKLRDPVNAALGSPNTDTVWIRPAATDANPPKSVALETPPGNGWYTGPVDLTIKAYDDDSGSGIACIKFSVNDGQETTVNGGVANPEITDNGLNTLKYSATDKCGNVRDGTPVTVLIDLAPPETICTMQADSVNPTIVHVTLTADDGAQGQGSGVKTIYYKKPGDIAFQAYSDPFTVADGSGAVEYYSIDNANHQEAVKSRPITVDLAPPVTTCTPGGTPNVDGWYHEAVTVTFVATDDSTGLQSTSYSLNGQDWTTYTDPFTINDDGLITVYYRSTDRAGNVEPVRTMVLKIDQVAPISNCETDPDTGDYGWTNQETVVTLTADDYIGSGTGPVKGGSGVRYIKYSLDDGATWTTYVPSDTPCTFVVTREGETQLQYYAEDNLGNLETPVWTKRIAIDRSPPTIEHTILETAQPDGSYLGTVTVVYTATEPLDGSGFTSAGGTVKEITWSEEYHADHSGLEINTTPVDRAGNEILYVVGTYIIREAQLKLGNIDAPTTPIAQGSAEANIQVSVTYSGGGDIVRNTWKWDDKTVNTSGQVNAATNTITNTHKFNNTGIYTVIVTVTDSTGAMVSTQYNYVVIFDPNGLLSGLGIANSPVGAYPAAPTRGGSDIFATYSEYVRGKMVACSFCDFNYNSGRYAYDDLLLLSTSNDWMVVSGNNAFFQGTGLILEKRPGQSWKYESGYKFLFAGLDGNKVKPKTTDKFRMKIWNPQTGVVKYDNLPGGEIDASPTTAIRLGNILVQG